LRPLEILGSLAGGLAKRERGWRVRVDSGVEATLVREPGGAWYADEPISAPGTGTRSVRAGRRAGGSASNASNASNAKKVVAQKSR
jgi:hypothetical protein